MSLTSASFKAQSSPDLPTLKDLQIYAESVWRHSISGLNLSLAPTSVGNASVAHEKRMGLCSIMHIGLRIFFLDSTNIKGGPAWDNGKLTSTDRSATGSTFIVR